MRGMHATLSVISAFASLALSLSAFLSVIPVRETTIILWVATLTIAMISGTIAHEKAVRERSGLARSMIGLIIAVISLVVGIVGFLL